MVSFVWALKGRNMSTWLYTVLHCSACTVCYSPAMPVMVNLNVVFWLPLIIDWLFPCLSLLHVSLKDSEMKYEEILFTSILVWSYSWYAGCMSECVVAVMKCKICMAHVLMYSIWPRCYMIITWLWLCSHTSLIYACESPEVMIRRTVIVVCIDEGTQIPDVWIVSWGAQSWCLVTVNFREVLCLWSHFWTKYHSPIM